MNGWPDEEIFRALANDPMSGARARDVWKSLAAMQRAGSDAVRVWVAERTDWLPRAALGIGLAAIESHLYAAGSDRELGFDAMCRLRSGLEMFRHGFLIAGLDDPADPLQLERWDDVLEILGAPDEDEPKVTPPPRTPPDHWWWRVQTEGRPANKDYDAWDPD